eukprot:CAMPEP_0172650808 /NCGR_PEP_ID=MMETSP1068-20121228/242483_1 /TAXON_ID=35684 /ORGANISM="Pseudopedinella elastica, Strain CCMP716" /LENGTH=772 /DNA_ID=CAMNT_0013465181 /DNA_START=33 /DNA_END=2351 /DNA_ORIENTATION=-
MELAPVTPKAKDLVILTVLMAIPTVLFILGFSAMAYGIPVYKKLVENDSAGTACIGIALVIALVLYLFDAEYWTADEAPRLNKLRQAAAGSAVALFLVGCVFQVESLSYGPVCVYLVAFVAYVVNLQPCVGVFGKHDTSTRQFVGSLSWPLMLTALWVFAWWVVWANQTPTDSPTAEDGYRVWSPVVGQGRHANWSPETKIAYAQKMGCQPEPDLAADPRVEDPYPDCLYAFLLWSAPGQLAFACAVFALTAYVLDPHEEHGAPKMIGQGMVLLLFGMWCSASISGAGSVITTALFAFILAGMVGIALFVVYCYGLELFENPEDQPFVQSMVAKYGGMADPLRGLLIVTSAPIIAAYFALSALNQLLRKRLACLGCAKKLDESDRDLVLTKVGAGLLESMVAWRWTSVLVYALYWGVFFFTCNVIISKFTVLFLSVLIAAIADLSVAVVSLVFFVVGFIMFMLPPVPGVPVYLSSGIILVAACEDSMGLSGAIFYAFIFCMVLKLLAAMGQMFIFGVPLGKYTSVRQAVGVNSDLVRSMKLVLAEPGLSMAKVTILTGGPDWPTSVMCGILKLNPAGVLLGTLPVALLILPTILAGSYFFLASRDPKFGVLATVFAATAALVQSGSMFVAAYYLDKAAVAYKDELAIMPYDEEVREADRLEEEKKKRYAAATQWGVLPSGAKALLVAATALMVVACYLVQLFQCFVVYELTSRVKDLPGGQWYNLMTTTGFVACGIFVFSSCLLYAFTSWASSAANKWPPSEAGAPLKASQV